MKWRELINNFLNLNNEKTNNIKEDTLIVEENPSYLQAWDNYIGQDNIKNFLIPFLDEIKRKQDFTTHFLISGKSGTGKTTMARLIAQHLELPFCEIIASSIKTVGELIWKKSVTNPEGSCVIFIDEIHKLNKEIIVELFPIMTDFVNRGKKITPFVLIGATTEPGIFHGELYPFKRRFQCITLEDYSLKQIKNILKIHLEENLISDVDLDIIVNNCRYESFRALNMLKLLIKINDIDLVLKFNNIIENGLTKNDILYLDALMKNEKGMGILSIEAIMGLGKDQIEHDIEPYLSKTELVVKTSRGRKITDKGKIILEKYKTFLPEKIF